MALCLIWHRFEAHHSVHLYCDHAITSLTESSAKCGGVSVLIEHVDLRQSLSDNLFPSSPLLRHLRKGYFLASFTGYSNSLKGLGNISSVKWL